MDRTEGTATFLRDCYVKPLTNYDVLEVAKDQVRRRLDADRILDHSANLSHAREVDLKAAILGYQNEKPFVILGDVGRGKTTFLNYFREVAAQTVLQNYIQLTVNFITKPDYSGEVIDYALCSPQAGSEQIGCDFF